MHIILHGKAADKPDLREAVDRLRQEGHQLQVQVTWEGGDAVRFARQAVHEGVDIVVAGGGDGTLNEVVSGLLTATEQSAPRPSLGILPLGTANDFAQSAHIPLDPFEALCLTLEQSPTKIDVGRINERVFLNVATGGFGTQITLETPEELKKILGGAAYLLTGFMRFSSVQESRAKFTGPEFTWEGAFLVLAVGNGRQAGGGLILCPEAVINDGLFDLRILPNVPDEEVGTVLKTLLREGFDALQRVIVNARLPWVEIETSEELFINLDGEPLSGRHFRIETVPEALAIHLPKTSPLLTKPSKAEASKTI